MGGGAGDPEVTQKKALRLFRRDRWIHRNDRVRWQPRSAVGNGPQMVRAQGSQRLQFLADGDKLGVDLPHGRAQRRQRTIGILNPSPIQFQYDALREFVDFAVLNEYECQELSKHDNTFQGIQKLSELGVKHVIVTRSGSDVLLYTESKLQTFEVPATNVVDTSGAGDVFCGILVGALLHKLTINESIEAAIRCASHSTTAMGTVSSYPTGTTIKSILGII